MKVIKKYFKDNKQYFNFVRKHPELVIDRVYMTQKSIVAIISKRRGRPKQVVDSDGQVNVGSVRTTKKKPRKLGDFTLNN